MAKGDSSTFPLSPAVSAQLYQLYLQNKSFEDIRQLNKQFSLGQIINAYIEGRWLHLKREYLENLFNGAGSRAQQAAAESVDFLADIMAANRKFMGEELKRYIQTGEVTDNLRLVLGNMKLFKEAAEMLIKLTGQDQVTKVTGTVTHKHEVATAAIDATSKPKKGGELLAHLAKERKKKVEE